MSGYMNPYQNYFSSPYQNAFQAYQTAITPAMPLYTSPQISQQSQNVQQQPVPQTMTPPTIHVDMIQVKSIEEADSYPVNVGTTQMFQLADDSAIITKSVYANGQYSTDVYVKQAKKPASPAFDPSAYVTRDELEERLAGLTRFRRRAEEENETSGQN